MSVFILSLYSDAPAGERARLKLSDRALEADDIAAAREMAEQILGPAIPGKYAVLWDEGANAVWEQRSEA